MNKKINGQICQLQNDLLDIHSYAGLLENGEASPEDIQRLAGWALNGLYKITEEMVWEELNNGELVNA